VSVNNSFASMIRAQVCNKTTVQINTLSWT